jgi:hypothetical protein
LNLRCHQDAIINSYGLNVIVFRNRSIHCPLSLADQQSVREKVIAAQFIEQMGFGGNRGLLGYVKELSVLNRASSVIKQQFELFFSSAFQRRQIVKFQASDVVQLLGMLRSTYPLLGKRSAKTFLDVFDCIRKIDNHNRTDADNCNVRKLLVSLINYCDVQFDVLRVFQVFQRAKIKFLLDHVHATALDGGEDTAPINNWTRRQRYNRRRNIRRRRARARAHAHHLGQNQETVEQ